MFKHVPSTGFTTIPVTPKNRPWNETDENKIRHKHKINSLD